MTSLERPVHEPYLQQYSRTIGHTGTEVHGGSHWLCSRLKAVRCLVAVSFPSHAHVNHTVHSTQCTHTSRLGSSAGTPMMWRGCKQVAPGGLGSELTHPVHNKVKHLREGAAVHGVRDVKLLHLHRLLCRPAHAQSGHLITSRVAR